MAEFALAAPIFMLVVLGMIEGAAFAATATSLEYAVQQGGRMAALPAIPVEDPATTEEEAVKLRVVESAILVSVSEDDIDIAVTDSSGTAKTLEDRYSGDRVSVSLTYDYTPLTVLVFGGSASFEINPETEYYVE